jgi:hypothetical protein
MGQRYLKSEKASLVAQHATNSESWGKALDIYHILPKLVWLAMQAVVKQLRGSQKVLRDVILLDSQIMLANTRKMGLGSRFIIK